MKVLRRKTRVIKIGGVSIGGNNPVAIQSMIKVKTSDIKGALRQIGDLESAGCQIVRLAIKDKADAQALKAVKRKSSVPLVADIHFDWRLALEAINNGADKIRLNPGNIYEEDQIKRVVKAAKLRRIPIRVGVNSGSLRQTAKRKAQTRSIAERMVKSALEYIKILEGFDFRNIVISLKASNILDTVEAYRKMAVLCDYPFHLGVTATGLPFAGAIKSSIAIGSLLLDGIGDTIRVSLTDRPREEIRAAKSILEALKLNVAGPEIISCPTCGRCEVNLVRIVKDLEKRLSTLDSGLLSRPIKLAVMGCVVNGPGESKEADIGVAFGKKEGLLFRDGKPVRKIPSAACVGVLLEEMLKKK